MTEDEVAEMQRRRQERHDQLKREMERAVADTTELADQFMRHPLPWTWGLAFHDGWFVQFFDANGAPCLGDDLRDPDDAAFLLHVVNLIGPLSAAHRRDLGLAEFVAQSPEEWAETVFQRAKLKASRRQHLRVHLVEAFHAAMRQERELCQLRTGAPMPVEADRALHRAQRRSVQVIHKAQRAKDEAK